MKRKTIKAKLTAALSAGVAFTMLAPAMPAYAATGSISFDMGKTYNALRGDALIGISGNQGAAMPGTYTDGSTIIDDTFANNQSPTSGGMGYFEMPFWDTTWLNASGVNLNGNTPPSIPPNYNFPGYLLKGWYKEDPEVNPSQTRVNHLPNTIPYSSNTTYYAAFVADTNKKYIYTQKHESATNVHAPLTTDGTYPISNTVHDKTPTVPPGSPPGTLPTVPVPTDNSVNSKESKNVLQVVSSRPLNIYGYKGTIKEIAFTKNTTSGSMTETLDTSGAYGDGRYINPTTLVDGVENLASQYRFVYNAAGPSFTGQMVNRDLTTVIEYVVDPDQKSRLTVEHKILDTTGAVASTESEFNHTFKAEETITGISPKTDLITPQPGNTESRYKLQSAAFTNVGSVGPYKHTLLTINKNANGGILSDTATDASGLLDLTTETGTTYLATGALNAAAKMPNQGVTLEYTYVPNPNYRLNVRTKYLSQDGTDLTSIVATKTSTTVGSDGMIETLGAINSTVNIPYPDLSTEGYNTPTYSISGGTPGAAGVVPNPAGNTATADLATDSYVVTVTYPRIPSFWSQVMFQTEGNGSLEDPDYPVGTSHPYTNANTNAIRLPVNGDNSVDIPLTTVLPHAVAAAGYEFKGYYDVDTGTQVTDENGAFISSTPYHLVDPGQGLVAKFEHNSSWLTFTFKFAGSHGDITPAGPVTGSVYPLDGTGAPRAIRWAELDPDDPGIAAEFVGVRPSASADTGYVIKWFDASGAEIAAGTDIAAYPNGSVFTARAVTTTPLSLDQPTATTSINTSTGAAEITVSNFNGDPTVQYVVTTPDGTIVESLSNMNLQALNGVISGPRILADTEYQIREVAPDATVTIGSNISSVTSPTTSPAVGSPTDVTTPVAVAPQVVSDPSDPNRMQMVLSPVTPGQSYAVVDDQGNVVADWTTPTGNSLTVPNLTPGRNYSLVTRPVTDTTSTPASRPRRLDFVAANISNVITLVNPSDINVVSPAGLDLDDVPAGTVVELRANPISGSNIFTSNWEFVLGQPLNLSNDGSTTIRFTMPTGRIIVKALYDTDASNWDSISGNDALRSDGVVGPGGSIGASNPLLNIPGDFRVVINRTRVSNSDKLAIQDTLTDDRFTGVWSIVAKVQQKVSGTWQDYVDPNLLLDSFVNMGALEDSGRTYMLHHMATGSNADRLTDADSQWNPVSSFNGLFTYSFLNGEKYVFGYTTADSIVTFVDTITGSTVTTAQVAPGSTLRSVSSQYRSDIPAAGSKVEDGNTGLTWTYVGLKKTATGVGDVDENDIVNGDMTVYLYYTNDQTLRNQLVDGLNDSITKGDALDLSKYKASDASALQAKLAEAKALLARTAPSMAVSSELSKVLNELNTILKSMGVNTKPTPGGGSDSGGGRGRGRGGRGGSGGGSGTAGKKSTGNNSGIRVGLDGNWELMNPAEAQSNPNASKWRFNLTNGGSVTGWAYLTYTYEGRTKSEWYHFGNDNIMDSGWFLDSNNTWYYLSMNHDGFFGEMVKGWHHDGQDGRWYYLDPNSGAMHTNWSKIGGEYYFLNPTAPAQTWFFDNVAGRWNYGDVNSRPFGSMYQNETTPDGYHVNESGAWR